MSERVKDDIQREITRRQQAETQCNTQQIEKE